MKVTEDGVPVQDVIAAVKLAIKEARSRSHWAHQVMRPGKKCARPL
jgi:hypothetical protein